MKDRARRFRRHVLRPAAEALVALLAAAGVVGWTETGSAQVPTSDSPSQPLQPAAGPGQPAPPSTASPPSSPFFPVPSSGGRPQMIPQRPGNMVPPPPPPALQLPLPQPASPVITTRISSVKFSEAASFQFTIDPKTPLKDLLPIPPKAAPPSGPLLTDDLTRVPEVSFQQAPAKELPAQESLKQNAHTIAKINHVNRAKSDAFMEALLSKRTDLVGLPFAMGDACRMNGERSRAFKQALDTVRQALRGVPQPANSPAMPSLASASSTQFGAAPANAAEFWGNYQTSCVAEDKQNAREGAKHCEHVTLARIAALMQVLAPESATLRKGLVKYLAGVSHPEATKALAKLALFSAEDEIRTAAIDALKVRRERDYTDILLRGLRYPYAPVARRASDALVKLERTDLLDKLVDLLEAPDPRLPVTETAHGKRVPVVRELVRINHHRNCMLCHSPGNTPGISPETVTAAVPTPGEPMTPPLSGYNQSPSPDVLIRVDVTYLRQDFSVMQPVADAHPWPAMQRFDFLVRRRVLSDKEADGYREKLTPRERGRLSPYHRAVLAALRELTGRDAAPTPQAWRELLSVVRKEGPLTTR